MFSLAIHTMEAVSVFSPFFFSCSATHRDLHSFPTRRSSDLLRVQLVAGGALLEALEAALHELFAEFPMLDEVDRKSTRLNSSHRCISYAVFCLKKKKIGNREV